MRRLLVIASTLACLAPGGLPALAQDTSSPPVAEGVTVEPLFDITLGPDALPADLAGVLVFRKVYPAGQDISYGSQFVPPNSFVRYVESGELGLKPHGDATIIRDAATAPSAELVAAEEETTVRPGDVFALLDVPFDTYGKDALGTMWHEGTGDAQVVGFAIREKSRCCAMTHAGMVSPWHATLSGDGLEAMVGRPITVTMRKVHLAPGAALPASPDPYPTERLVDEGTVHVVALPADASGREQAMDFATGQSFSDRTFPDVGSLVISNAGMGPATILETVIQPADPDASVATRS